MNRLLIILLIAVVSISCKQNALELKSSDSQTYIRIWGDDGYMGYIEQSGDTIIPLNVYKYLNPIDDNGMILGEYQGKNGYININQDTLIPFIYDYLGSFFNELATAKLNGKFGFIDRKGKVIIPFQFETGSDFSKCGLARVSKNNKYGFVDSTGKVIIPLEFEAIRDNEADEFVCSKKNGKWAFFSCEGKQLTGFDYDKITEVAYTDRINTYFKKGLCLVQKNGKLGYINSAFKTIVPFGKFEILEPYQNYLAIVSKNDKYGVIDTLGNFVLPLEYDFIEHPGHYTRKSKNFIVKKNGKLQLVDENTKPITKLNITEYEWDRYRNNKESNRYFILKNDLGFVGAISETGNSRIPFNYNEIHPFDGKSVAIANINDKYGLIDFEDKVVYPFENNDIITNRFFDFFIVNKSGKFGMVNEKGKVILPFIYQSIEPCFYDDNERFIVKKDNFYGIIDVEEKIIIPIEYDEISNWVEYGPDEHYITKNGKKGLISREGVIVIPLIYEEILVNNAKLIKVKKNGLFGTVNWNNEIIHNIEYEQILWEWPYLTDKPLDTVYIKKNNSFFTTDTNGRILEQKISDKHLDSKLDYLLIGHD